MAGKPTLKSALESGAFVITAEITPRLSAAHDAAINQVAAFRDLVNAINVTEYAGARVTTSSLAACARLAADGLDPVLQVTCRDRNRISIAGDLLGAATLGISNVLVLTGDNPTGGDEPDAKGVFDLSSIDVLSLAVKMRDRGVIASGRELDVSPDFFLGTVDAPIDPPAGWQPDRLAAKVDAGAQFIQTQFCFDPDATRRYVDALASAGVLDKAALIIGIGPLASARSARWMDENLFGVSIPDNIIERLDNAEDAAAEGLDICAELIRAYRDMDGVAGVHVMAPAQNGERIAAAINAA